MESAFRRFLKLFLGCLCGTFSLLHLCLLTSVGWSQGTSPFGEQDTSPSTVVIDSDEFADLARAALEPRSSVPLAPTPGIDVVSLLFKGGWLMLPIGAISIFVVALALERWVALRRSGLIPRRMVRKLNQLSLESDSLDPCEVYRLANQYPSATGRVLQSALVRVGRPQSEVSNVVKEATQREADRLHGGVRWLSFAAAVAPLLGLLGTVWGLIHAFHDLTLLSPSQSKAEFLGRGIYEALVTTLAGLVVAIPAALFAHFFEGKIVRLFQEIEEIVGRLLPKFEKYEGKTRFDVVGQELVVRPSEMKRVRSEGSEGRDASAPVVPRSVIH